MSSSRLTIVFNTVSALFILLFVYTAVSKISNAVSFRISLYKSPWISDHTNLLLWLVPAVELLIALLLFIPSTRLWGLIGSLILMTIFTVYVAAMMVFASHLPCSCGGVIRRMTWRQHLVFNLLFTSAAAIAIYCYNRSKHSYKSLLRNEQAQPKTCRNE